MTSLGQRYLLTVGEPNVQQWMSMVKQALCPLLYVHHQFLSIFEPSNKRDHHGGILKATTLAKHWETEAMHLAYPSRTLRGSYGATSARVLKLVIYQPGDVRT